MLYDYRVRQLVPPFAIVTETSASGSMTLRLRDSGGEDVATRSTDPEQAAVAYAELDSLRDTLDGTRDILEEVLATPGDGMPARDPTSEFDGCRPRTKITESGLTGPMLFFALMEVMLFFVLPTVAAVLLGLAVLVWLLHAVVAFFSDLSSVFRDTRDEKECHLRVIRLREVPARELTAESGLAVVQPNGRTWLTPRLVVFGRLDDIGVFAAAERDPAAAARVVGAELQRQRMAAETRKARAEVDVAAAADAAAKIADAEARHLRDRGVW